MPQGYCIECRAHVTVRNNACLLGHPVDLATTVAGNGRHRAARSHRIDHHPVVASRGAIGVGGLQLESEIPEIEPQTPPPPSIPTIDPSQDAPAVPHEATPGRVLERDPAPAPGPEPWTRPQRLPMLELLGFTDPDFEAVITTTDPPAARPLPPARTRLARAVPEEAARFEPPTKVARLADVQTGENPQNTGVLVARLWEATSEHPPLGDDWAPTPTVEAPQRTFRWSFVSTALTVAVAITFLSVAAIRWPINQAADLRRQLAVRLTALEEASALIPEAGANLVDAGQTGSELTGVALPLLALSNAANQAYAAASADPGPDLPLVSSAPLDELSATQFNLQRAADQALVIHEQIGDVLDYRILLDRAFVLPESLPVVASDPQISDIGVGLSETLAETTEVLLRLPQNDLLAEHRLLLEAAFAEMDSQVSDYLAALRTQNQFAASRLAGEMRSTAAATMASLDTTLDDFDGWLTDAFEQLQQRLGTTSGALQASGS